MDFRGVVEDTADEVQDLIEEILRLDISPDAKIEQIELVFAMTGTVFANQMFGDISYLLDSTAILSTIETNRNDQIAFLAQKIVRDSAFSLNDKRITTEYFDVLLARAEDAAFRNANSLEKHPTLTRYIVGETCDWCVKLAGVHTDPDYDVFARHDDCDCKFVVSGYKSRNGRLDNYTKASVASKFQDTEGNTISWNERIRRIESGEDRNNFIKIKE